MKSTEQLRQQMNYEKTFDCVQCGYCLPVCPTYETMGKETHSPRGRISLMKLAAEGKIDLEDLREPIEKCLGCRACETACPTHVQYGQLLEGAKEALADHEQPSLKKKTIKKTLFDHVFPSRASMQTVGNLTWFYQQSGLQNVSRKVNLLSLLPTYLQKFERILPVISPPKERRKRASLIEGEGKKRGRVGFFAGCVMDTLFHQTNEHTIQLLTKSGLDVVIPDAQTCCGALHAHAGYKEEAKSLAQKNIETFERANVDYVVHNAGGCGAMLAEYHLLFEDAEWEERAGQFMKKSKDISWILAELDSLEFTKKQGEVVTYQPSCHLTHVQKVVEEPVKLIEKIPGSDFRPMKDAGRCCGSAGIYNLEHYDEAMDILDMKMEKYLPTKAKTIVTTNPGCLLQMKMGVQREHLPEEVRVIHLVDLLIEAKPERKQGT